MGDNTDIVLGSFWPDRSGQLRAQWDQGVHQVLGTHHVRQLLADQHHRPSQSPDCHDEPLLSTDQCQLGKIKKEIQFCIFQTLSLYNLKG